MQKERNGWPSCWLYMAAALVYTYIAAMSRNWELGLHVLAMTVLVFHGMVRMCSVGKPHYLISMEKIRTEKKNEITNPFREQLLDMLTDGVPLALASTACLIGQPRVATLMWFFLCVYKFGVQAVPSKRETMVPLMEAGMGKWMPVFFLVLVGYTAGLAILQPSLLEIAIALVTVMLLVAIQHNVAWLYLSPAIVLLLVFTVWPIINTVSMAFLEGYSGLTNAGGEVTFRVGLGNFVHVVGNPSFKQALKNTVLLCVITVPISTVLALLIAVALNAIKPLRKALQTIFFLPYVTNSIAIGMVFATMFNIIGSVGTRRPVIISYGIVNDLIRFLTNNADPKNYVNFINSGSEYWANMLVMVVYIVWNALPFKILVLLGGLQSINKQYYDAAKVDSAPRWRVLTRITVPLLSPMIAYVVITGFIGGFKEYTSIVGIFGEKMGPPNDQGRLNTMVGLIYDALELDNQGGASAAALILFGIILIVTLINLRVSKKRVHY